MTEAQHHCPTCNAPLSITSARWDEDNRVFMANGVAVKFTRVQAQIVGILWDARHSGGILGQRALAGLVYKDAIQPVHTVTVHMNRLRRMLKPTGYTITMSRGKPRTGFRIVPIEGAK